MSSSVDNIRILQNQINNINQKYKDLETLLRDYNDKELTLQTIEEIEKIENELSFLHKYYKVLENQLVVIMNEHH
jgi:hypothetical protein